MSLSHYSADFHKLLETKAKTANFSRQETIINTDNIKGLYCVKKGFVKRFMIKNDGSISVHGVYGPGDCFGITFLVSKLVDSSFYSNAEIYHYEAINNVTILEVNYGLLIEALKVNAKLYRDLFTIQGWHSLSDILLLESQALENAQKRVAHIIYFYMARYGVENKSGKQFKVPFIQQDIADLLNLSRETVSLAISGLRELGLVKDLHSITVPNLGKLREYSYS